VCIGGGGGRGVVVVVVVVDVVVGVVGEAVRVASAALTARCVVHAAHVNWTDEVQRFVHTAHRLCILDMCMHVCVCVGPPPRCGSELVCLRPYGACVRCGCGCCWARSGDDAQPCSSLFGQSRQREGGERRRGERSGERRRERREGGGERGERHKERGRRRAMCVVCASG